MPTQVALHHTTHYRYDRPVQLAPQIVRLRPAPHCRTPIHGYSLQVVPANHHLSWQQDPQANFQARLVFPEPTDEFTVEVALTAEMVSINPFDFFLEPHASQFPFQYDRETANELCAYLRDQRGAEPPGPKLASFLSAIRGESTGAAAFPGDLNRPGIPGEPSGAAAFPGDLNKPGIRGESTGAAAFPVDLNKPAIQGDTVGTMEFLVGLNKRVQAEIGYVRRPEPGIQTCEETLDLRQGSCRDSAWLLVQIVRHLGLAARFVSGYLIQTGGELGESADLHAWAEVYLPGAGWVGFDPTSGLLAAEGHIPLACTPEPARAAPVSGQVTACQVEFHYEMRVIRY